MSTRVNRSVRVSVSPDPTPLVIVGLKLGVLSVKFVVSTTRVSPSQWPRASPIHWRMSSGGCGRPSKATTRASCTISLRMTT